MLALWTEKPPDAHGMPACSGEDIKWNFAKFLVDADGDVVKRYPPQTAPSAIEQDVVALLHVAV